MSRLRSLVVGMLLGGPLYLLLIDTVDTPELLAGAVATLLAAAVYEVSYSQGFADAAFRAGDLREVARAFTQVPRGIAIVSLEIVCQTVRPRSERGRVRSSPFETGDEDAYDLGRRAMTEALGSLAPDSFVIGIDLDRNELLMHRLR
jgi:hypothetical protein